MIRKSNIVRMEDLFQQRSVKTNSSECSGVSNKVKIMDKKIPVIAVIGPTASGKTGLAVKIAQNFNGEVVSADSMQIYSELSVGTAKPSEKEMAGIVHHLIGHKSIDEEYSVVDYVEEAKAVINDIIKRGKIPVLCGGTGLYVDSLLSNT